MTNRSPRRVEIRPWSRCRKLRLCEGDRDERPQVTATYTR